VVRLQTVAFALVLNEVDEILLLWRHRFVTDSFGWELPGGIVTDDENGARTAVRETEEETGWRPTGSPEHLITFQPMPGMVDTPHEVYLLRGAEYIGAPTDREEAGRVEWVQRQQIAELLRAGEVAAQGHWSGCCTFLGSGRS
jgi:8-oxo-dGTP pyrophosphatase MutT (NUDIX family)